MYCKVLLAAGFGVAAATSAAPGSYSDDVADVRAMMEGVRAKTEGHVTLAADGKAVKEVAKMVAKSDEQFPGLADELMHNANRIQEEISNSMVTKKGKKTALAVKDTVSSHDRAARFFATHGMKSVGQMLGDLLSADEEKKAISEEASVQKRLRASIAADALAPAAPTKTVASKPAVAADPELDALAGEDDEDDAEKKRWAAVDALKHRAHHFH
eukprot:TRINITY_DN16327_c0_g2_i1.p1 TRINITY_DN16327_c0_g2~~TRINITY_DN16327_c0_g2_i1.p1  ORF type:complete len:214 (+),score=73.34 TRINITY_DN16327_c0_g2_i1:79-720(+)